MVRRRENSKAWWEGIARQEGRRIKAVLTDRRRQQLQQGRADPPNLLLRGLSGGRKSLVLLGYLSRRWIVLNGGKVRIGMNGESILER